MNCEECEFCEFWLSGPSISREAHYHTIFQAEDSCGWGLCELAESTDGEPDEPDTKAVAQDGVLP